MLTLNLMGDLEVIKSGDVVKLPPSKKTRALLGYLVLAERPVSRERLCELFWELPDDPRGSLRWSLSKLRRLLASERNCHILSEKSRVAFNAEGINVDVLDLRKICSGDLFGKPVPELESLAKRYRGHLFEGLDLLNLHEFSTWCAAERESVLLSQCKLLRHLIERDDCHDTARLAHATSLVSLNPYSEDDRALLVDLLIQQQRFDEAEQQYRQGNRMLQEVAAAPNGKLLAAFKNRVFSKTIKPVGAVSTRNIPPQSAHQTVGRDAIIADLNQRFEQTVSEQRPQMIILLGEAGIGKTELLNTMSLQFTAAGVKVLQAESYETDLMRPFSLWSNALRDIDEHGFERLLTHGAENREGLFEELSQSLDHLATNGPLVLLFDDFQWCDESSIAALHVLIRSRSNLSLFVIATGRPEEMQDKRHVSRLIQALNKEHFLHKETLNPLCENDIETLVSTRIPSAEDVENIAKNCKGNPLLALELSRAQIDGNNGQSLRELVREKLAQFEPVGVELLQWAAVLMPHAELNTMRQVCDLSDSEIVSAIERAETQSLLIPDGPHYRFTHSLITESIYDDISPTRRKLMHLRVARMLEETLDAERASDFVHHATLSGDVPIAVRAIITAGRSCLRYFANDEAAELAKKGLYLIRTLPEQVRVTLELDLHDVLLSSAPLDDWASSAESYVELAERALDNGALGKARLGYHMASTVKWAHGDWSSAREEMLQAERVGRSAGHEDQVTAMAETARCLAMLERDLGKADALLMEAESLAHRHHMKHRALNAAKGMLLFHRGDLDGATESFSQYRNLCKIAGNRVDEFQANEYLVMIEIEKGRDEISNTEVLCKRVAVLLELSTKIREGSEVPYAQALWGYCEYLKKDDQSQLQLSIRVLREADAKHRLAFVLNSAARLDLRRNHYDSAIERAKEALTCAIILDRCSDMVYSHALLALAFYENGDMSNCSVHIDAIRSIDCAKIAIWAKKQADAATELHSMA